MFNLNLLEIKRRFSHNHNRTLIVEVNSLNYDNEMLQSSIRSLTQVLISSRDIFKQKI